LRVSGVTGTRLRSASSRISAICCGSVTASPR
jgi:hypothetical protein